MVAHDGSIFATDEFDNERIVGIKSAFNVAAKIETAYRDAIAGMSVGDKHYEFLNRHFRELQAEIQLEYLDFDKFPKTEAEVRGEFARQAEEYIKFGLHKHPAIGRMTKGKFKDGLVRLADAQPERFSGRFDIPNVVLGQVPTKDVFNAAGADYFLGGLDVCDWPDDPKGYATQRGFYRAWISNGSRNLSMKVETVRANLEIDARGATEVDGAGLYVAHPRILTHHFLDFPGTSVERGSAPYLYLFGGRPKVSYYWVDVANPEVGSALCGRN